MAQGAERSEHMKHVQQPDRHKVDHTFRLDCGCLGNDKPQVERYPGRNRRVCYHHATDDERAAWLALVTKPPIVV